MIDTFIDLQTGALISGDELEVFENSDKTARLGELICSTKFKFTSGDFPQLLSRQCDHEVIVAAGAVVAHSVAMIRPDGYINSEDLRRAYILGIIPSETTLYRRFGSLSKYIHEIGARSTLPSKEYGHMNDEQFAEYVCEKYKSMSEDSPLTLSKLAVLTALGIVPSRDYIQMRVGGIRELNEKLGYPNISKWDITDYIDFGVRVMKHNNMPPFRQELFEKLNTTALGPHPAVIVRRFGSLKHFQEDCLVQYNTQKQSENQFTEDMQNHFDSHTSYPKRILLSAEARKRSFGLYLLLASCLPSAEQNTLLRQSMRDVDYVLNYIVKNSYYSLAEVEIHAESINVAGVIWPVTDQIRKPIVP